MPSHNGSAVPLHVTARDRDLPAEITQGRLGRHFEMPSQPSQITRLLVEESGQLAQPSKRGSGRGPTLSVLSVRSGTNLAR